MFVGVEVRNVAEKDKLLRALERSGIPTLDLTGNEMAKLHVRHLVGGRARAEDEVLYRFEFPERPGALMRFLDSLGEDLEHQPLPLPQPRRRLRPRARRHPGAPWRQAPVQGVARAAGYPYVDETHNPAAGLFLRDIARDLEEDGDA